MHLLLRDTKSLDAIEEAVDLGQSPADLVVLSFTDSDLAAVAGAHSRLHRARGGDLAGLRVASLQKLRHPGSVDLYLDTVAERAKTIVVRLLGGLDYWRYGAEELGRIAREKSIALAIVPGDGRADSRCAELSTVGVGELARIERYWIEGGPANMAALVDNMARLGGITARPAPLPAPVPRIGYYKPDLGPCCPMDCLPDPQSDRPRALICFYRSLLLADDTDPIDALIAELGRRGIDAVALFAGSLKDAEAAAWVSRAIAHFRPGVILNATAFSARREAAAHTALDVAGVPVLQIILSGAAEEAWRESGRGLSAADLAMNVVLPELDGRLLAGPVSFKAEAEGERLQEWPLLRHGPHRDRLAAAVDKAERWLRLAAKTPADRRLALILSDYPGGGRAAHAVGLDGSASALAILQALKAEGYRLPDLPANGDALLADLEDTARADGLGLDAYLSWLERLPGDVRADLAAAWGAPEDDPDLIDGAFRHRALVLGHVTLAIQPDRGSVLERKDQYHDPDLPPRHGYLAFYAWLHRQVHIDAMIHLGTHGTLEWLPGKAVALSDGCYPEIACAGVPLLYPFIVNNPGEAAAAKRRLGAVTIGHMTPPLSGAAITGPLAEIERLVDDYAAAEGLDPRRMKLLRTEIVRTAREYGLDEECGLSPDMSEDEAIAQLDAYLCDLKDLQIRDGLHVFGVPAPETQAAETARTLAQTSGRSEDALRTELAACARCEMQALLDGLDGRFVAPGPAGAPSRGRIDVLPTGRNLYTVDPRAVPTRTAFQLGKRTADEFVRRYIQDNGDYPRSVILDLWGSATMRTGGDDLGQAFALLGVAPIWDHGSNRVSGFEVLPLAQLDRPRIDVTLRISGLFRDVFEEQIKLFDEAVRTVAELDEEPGWNPLAGFRGSKLDRVFGAAPGAYGSGIGDLIARGAWSERADLGAAYLQQSGYAYGVGRSGVEASAELERQLAAADAHVQVRDSGETDILDRTTYGEFQGGAAAAAERGGNRLKLYHADTTRPDSPKVRTLREEVTRVVRGRAANPQWIAGQMRHGYAGAAEFANTLDALFAEAATTALPFSRQFDLYFDATLGDETVDRFLAEKNPNARRAMAARFREAIDRAIWQPRRNSVLARLSEIDAETGS